MRCKLKCIRANGRVTDCSHYHCCLCGRVCLRKVHLCCHLQAHALGTAKVVDDVNDDVMDASLIEEEQEGGEGEGEDDDEEEELGEKTLNSSDSIPEMSHMACSAAADSNIVALTEGTQVVYVQSMHDGETLTVLPVSDHSESLTMSQAQQISSDVTSNQLTSDLQVMTSPGVGPDVQAVGDQESSVIVKHMEVILDPGESGVPNSQVPSDSVHPVENTSAISQNLDGTYSEQQETEQQLQETPLYPEHSYNEFPASAQREQMLQKPSHVNTGLTNQVEEPLADRQFSSELASQEQSVTVEGMSAVSSALDQLIMTTSAVNSHMTMSSESPIQPAVVTARPPIEPPTHSSAPFTSTPYTPQSSQVKSKPADHDSILLVSKTDTPREDDHVFSKLFANSKLLVEEMFEHPSVLREQESLDVCRCKNTECDCRLYHCPLCTCLPNKPGRIKEHFKKIHSEDLIIRYQGFQMLRCKLGCCRPSGKRILNSHYHCCMCGCICISKSGVYEHIRTQHSAEASRPGEQATCKRHATPCRTPPAKRMVKEDKACEDNVQEPKQVVVQLKQDSTQRTDTSQAEPAQSAPEAGNNQTIAIQLPQIGDSVYQGASQPGMNQPLVILMPQNYNQGQAALQNQQPIVIVMPQGGAGGATMAQPIVVPLPQQTSSSQ
ncbi:predicted protein [Nematostella vectensis]|uniref:C2H2-type domain-containing protein n=2 Tax=Nematostella vectensis TaxID=45351 RepID=A7RHT7_NEMVE|nr:predicted protein [Nematostella vectensis]|eukprot:XP_001641096.1 predicted protein [Nematostella vectensis]